MGDAGNDNHERETNEKFRLKTIDKNIEANVKRLRELRSKYCEYQVLKADLVKLGYKITERGDNVKVWKEL